MKYRHLREHAIASFGDDDTAWPIKNVVSYDNAATDRQTMHEATVVPCIVEPWFVDTPGKMIFTELLVRQFVA